MNIIEITEADDPRLAAYRMVRERDLAGRDGLFIAEGKVVLRVLFTARRFEAESVLILGARLPGMRDVLAAVPGELPVYVAPQSVIDRVAGFHLHRGVLAAVRRGEGAVPEALLSGLKDDALVVAPIGISNHDNIGSIFRNAASFGADAVVMDRTCCDPLYRKAIRVSVGAALALPFARGGEGSELARLLAASGFELLALTGSGDTDIAEIVPGGRQALLLGTEGDGLPPEVLALSRRVRIPMSGRMDSLNVAAASAIALHRLFRGVR